MNMLVILNYYTMYIRIKTLHFSLQMSTIHIISMTKISIFLSVINISNMVEFLYTMYTEAHIQFSLLQSRESDQVCSRWAPVVPAPPPALALATTAAWAPATLLSLRHSYTRLSVVLH